MRDLPALYSDVWFKEFSYIEFLFLKYLFSPKIFYNWLIGWLEGFYTW